MNYWITYCLVFMVGIVPFFGVFLLAPSSRTVRPPGQFRLLGEKISLALLAVFLTLMGLEFYFKLFFAQSDSFRYTLASRNWFDRYWQVNSLGYRDVEWTPEKLRGKTKVMVAGDSFVAGSGIANPDDRFANQLGQLLSHDYVVFNVASPGWDTARELRAIADYPYRPDILVLSYYINDIKGEAYARGVLQPSFRSPPPDWLSPLVDNSYMANFLYWRLIRLGPQEWANAYWDWLHQITSDPDTRWQHRQELLSLVEGAASEHIPLLVVVFPHLTAIDESRFFTQPVIELFQEQGVPVLDAGSLLAGRDPAQITVNPVDAHPNESVHREVAERLYQLMIETKVVVKHED